MCIGLFLGCFCLARAVVPLVRFQQPLPILPTPGEHLIRVRPCARDTRATDAHAPTSLQRLVASPSTECRRRYPRSVHYPPRHNRKSTHARYTPSL